MTLVSMTGFAEARGAFEGLRWRWEAKSVNARGLDLRLRLPPGYDSLEPAIRTLAVERFRRGAVQASLALEQQESSRGFRIDPAALAGAVKVARQIAAETGLAPARVDGLLGLKGVIVQDEAELLGDAERLARDARLIETLSDAFDRLAAARRNEGAKLAAIIHKLLDEIETLTHEAASHAAAQPAALRERLAAQIGDLLAPGTVPEDRIAQEAALLAVKADVREELDRLAAHVAEARLLLKGGGGAGRKLDFLAQEFQREANTLCAKSADIGLTRIGLALKAAIDQLREQAQNVE